MQQLDLPQLEQLKNEWQKILSLESWDIRVCVTRRKQMPDTTCDGTNLFNQDHELAMINIVDPQDYESDLGAEQDMEETLLHELLHLVLSRCAPDENDALRMSLFEQSINRLSRAFIRIKRSSEIKA